jgi:hypothetical protein
MAIAQLIQLKLDKTVGVALDAAALRRTASVVGLWRHIADRTNL